MLELGLAANNARTSAGGLRCPGGAGRPSALVARPPASRPPRSSRTATAAGRRAAATAAAVVGGRDAHPLCVNATAAPIVTAGRLGTRNMTSCKLARGRGNERPETRPQSAPPAQSTTGAAAPPAAAGTAGHADDWTLAGRRFIRRQAKGKAEPAIQRLPERSVGRRRASPGAGGRDATAVERSFRATSMRCTVAPAAASALGTGDDADVGLTMVAIRYAKGGGLIMRADGAAAAAEEVGPMRRREGAEVDAQQEHQQAEAEKGWCRYSYAAPWSARNAHRLLAGQYEKVRLRADSEGRQRGRDSNSVRLGRHSCSEDAIWRTSDDMRFL
jgi:hypothetical protein